jgi:hypothetical protein
MTETRLHRRTLIAAGVGSSASLLASASLRAAPQLDAASAVIDVNRADPIPIAVPDSTGHPLFARIAEVTNADRSPLSAAAARAIGDSVQRCWMFDAGAKDLRGLVVLLTVNTDEQGVVRDAEVAAPDKEKLSDPVFRAFADRAIRAVRSPQCANLPVPRSMLGQRQTFTFRFRPAE